MSRILVQWASWQRAMRAWRRWFRHNAGHAALFAVLALSMVEPLGCLIHCRFWLLPGVAGATSAQHIHHHISQITGILAVGAPADLVKPRASLPDRSTSYAVATPDRLEDHIAMSGGYDAPVDTPAGPSSASFHEHQAALLILVIVTLVLLIQRMHIISPYQPPQTRHRPPLRPPILIALWR